MKYDIIINPIDDVLSEIVADKAILREIQDNYSFSVDGYEIMKRNNPNLKYWDGMIRLFKLKNRTLYTGLNPSLLRWAKDQNYTIYDGTNRVEEKVSVKDIQEFIKKIKLKEADMIPRDYQLKAFMYGVKNRRASFLSPVNSGKSLIMYMLARWFDENTLIIVPTVSLVNQMLGDFAAYSKFDTEWDAYGNCQIIMGGLEKEIQKKILISTWQSIKDLPAPWFKNIRTVMVDEVHGAKAKSIQNIMEKLTNCPNRFGLTGTFDGVEVNKLTVVGHFGDVMTTTTTKELQERNISADLDIEFKILEYGEVSYQECPKDYQAEMSYICENEDRNNYIKDLALSLEGNTLIMFQYVDRHGKILYELLKKNTKRKVFIIHGKIKVDDRQKIIDFLKSGKAKDCILIASYGTVSTGINIPTFNNMIFASPYKSKIKVWQSIGRLLRVGKTKTKGYLYDIVDCIRNGKSVSTKNYSMQHFLERVKIYNNEDQKYKMTVVKRDEWRK